MRRVVQKNVNTIQRSTHKWWALVILALAQFLVVLDGSIVNIALLGYWEKLNTNVSYVDDHIYN